MNWEAVFEESNNHLREQDTKRDQIVAFFIALTGFLVGAESINEGGLVGILFFIVFLLGCLMGIILTRYKIWHEKYVLAAVTVLTAMKNNRDCSKEEFSNYFKEVIGKKNISLKEIFVSSESMILNSFLLVNCVNLFFSSQKLGIPVIWLILVILIYLMFFNINLFLAMKRLYSADTSFESIWLLRFWR